MTKIFTKVSVAVSVIRKQVSTRYADKRTPSGVTQLFCEYLH